MPKRIRCGWSEGSFDDYIHYHDKEWGVPVHNDKRHFEFLILEGAQAGLSWSTILKRRGGYKKAFADFDVENKEFFKHMILLANTNVDKKSINLFKKNNVFLYKFVYCS